MGSHRVQPEPQGDYQQFERVQVPATKRNEIGSFAEMQIGLEPVIQSEVSQKEKNEFQVLMPMYGI